MPVANSPTVYAGSLRRYVDIQQRSTVRTAAGDRSTVWSTIFSAYADIQPMSGRERFAAGDIRNEVTHTISMRYDSRLLAANRIVWHGRYFNITGRPRNLGEAGELMEFEVIEGLSDG